MSENLNKQTKILRDLSEDLLVQISSYLPIKSLLQNRTLSKAFRNTEIKSLELDFSGLHSVRRRQSDVVAIIDNVMNNHVGPEIRCFACRLNHIGVEGNIYSWINMCIGKNIQELELDFSKSKRVLMIPIDFSAIKTLRVLKLRWCKFHMDNSSNGLRLLKTLSLTRTCFMNHTTIDAIFRNCIYLESLELIQCPLMGSLCIEAHNHRNFKSLVVSALPTLVHIIVAAPTLECFKYEGYVNELYFSGPIDALKEADLHYPRIFRSNDPSRMVVSNLAVIAQVSQLSTTTIFLEAFKYKYVGGGRLNKMAYTYTFCNLSTFRIEFKSPTICTLFDIAEFLKMCPNLKQVVIDINNFTFERNMFWEMHYKYLIENDIYRMHSLKEVKICGYKGQWHEFEIALFFVFMATSLEKLVLGRPTNQKINLDEIYDAHINHIKRISPRPNHLTVESS